MLFAIYFLYSKFYEMYFFYSGKKGNGFKVECDAWGVARDEEKTLAQEEDYLALMALGRLKASHPISTPCYWIWKGF